MKVTVFDLKDKVLSPKLFIHTLSTFKVTVMPFGATTEEMRLEKTQHEERRPQQTVA